MNAILTIGSADAWERMRRFTFLVIVAAALYAGYLYVPGAHAAYQTISMNGHRGLYNSAYVGAATTLLTTSFLSLVGFFFIRGSVERDAVLHVDGIVGATPVRKVTFLLGKWLSNLALLLAIAGVTTVAGMLLQEWRGEDRAFDLLAYLLPFALFTLPAMAFVASIGIVLDVIPWLRGVLGAILYVMGIWMVIMIVPLQSSHDLKTAYWFDPLATTQVGVALREASDRSFPHDRSHGDISIGGEPAPPGGFTIYRFDGFSTSASLVENRLAVLVGSILLVMLVSPLFDRFRRDGGRSRGASRWFNIMRYAPDIPPLRPLNAELALLLNGTNPWWALGALGLCVASALAPLDVAINYIVPVALIWPLERISTLGARENLNNMLDTLRATPGYGRRSVVLQIAAATVVQLIIAGGFLVRCVATGHLTSLLAMVVLAIAIAAIAIALGSWTGVTRAFQGLFLVVWYAGPINHAPGVDVVVESLKSPLAVTAGALVAATIATSFTLLRNQRQRA